ncbi:T9SS type A sorting domain-containing protein [bacterium]|nr:T9SS type A sorting domain-containing protein [bacterium]
MNNRFFRVLTIFFFTMLIAGNSFSWDSSAPLIIDHTATDLAQIPREYIDKAKSELHIAYGHTSHGSQLVTGMTGLVGFKGQLYAFNAGGKTGALDLRDTPFSGAEDLGNPDRTSWEKATRNYLKDHTDINVVIWSWCGQVSWASESDITTYLTLMSGLEKDYPGVRFVYMTGHLDGSGLNGDLHKRNEQIRRYCRENNKILYDFNDIESYDPDGTWFGDKIPNDNCDYDTDGNGSQDGNWAIEWQNAHPGEWYSCDAAHTQPLNANRKAYAAWWLWARLAGWQDTPAGVRERSDAVHAFSLGQNFPNPFNASTTIIYTVNEPFDGELVLYNCAGQKVKALVSGALSRGMHTVIWDGSDDHGRPVTSGVYLYRLMGHGAAEETKAMMYVK